MTTPQGLEQIVIVEDDTDIRELVTFNLEKSGYRVVAFSNGHDAWNVLPKLSPSVVLLDIMMPGMDGLQVLRKMREGQDQLQKTPVILLTAKGEESDIVTGLELGADDYVTKPFSTKELIARIKAMLRRSRESFEKTAPAGNPERVDVGPVALDYARHEVFIRGKQVAFTLAEFRLLETLTSKPGRVFTRDQLLEKITGGEAYVIDRNVDVHVRAIRKKLDADMDFIMTVRGIGYKCRDYEERSTVQTA